MATATVTATATATPLTARPAAAVNGTAATAPKSAAAPEHAPANPKDSMKSTWMFWDRSQWKLSHKLIHALDAYPMIPGVEPPVHAKSDPVPNMPQWTAHVFILAFCWIPFALHQLWHNYVGPMHPVGVVLLYTNVLNFVLIHEVRMLRKVGYKHGYFDGDKHARDGIPDVGILRVVASIYKTVAGRLSLFVFLLYDRNVAPKDVIFDWKWVAWTWLAAGIYGIVLDFWFYVYHRSMHDVPSLWKFHRTHHLTKHPNAALSAYAGDEQEFGDMIIVPALTYYTMRALGMNLGFYDWWICLSYVIYSETMGHSGVRVHSTVTSTLYPLLRFFDVELALEDHDLHHRKGWRKSFNYGKQTKLWDTLFGTALPRVESTKDNIDYENPAYLPLF